MSIPTLISRPSSIWTREGSSSSKSSMTSRSTHKSRLKLRPDMYKPLYRRWARDHLVGEHDQKHFEMEPKRYLVFIRECFSGSETMCFKTFDSIKKLNKFLSWQAILDFTHTVEGIDLRLGEVLRF